jgi:dihydrofolate synthase/folylpolyglutamate synthase
MTVIKNGENVFPQLKLDLLGLYQRKNLPAVLKAVELLQKKGWDITEEAVYEGLANVTELTGLQGRWQILGANPAIVCDTGHNFDGITEVLAQIEQTAHKKLHVVFGMVNDKDPDKILAILPKNAEYYFTKAGIPRALNEKILREKAAGFELVGNSYPTVIEAFEDARQKAGENDLIYVGGSTFVVAEIL